MRKPIRCLSRCLKLPATIFAVVVSASLPVFCADSAVSYTTTTYNSSSSATTVTNSSCTVTTVYTPSGAVTVSTCSVTIEDRLERFREKLPELKVQEAVINVSPKMRIYLPSGAFDMTLNQRYRKTAMELNTKYDFIDSYMGFALDFTHHLSKLSLGVGLADIVDFNEVYSETQYIQRSQSITPYTLYPVGANTKLKTSIKIDDTYTSSISSNTLLEQGRNILGEIGLWNDTITESTSVPQGGSASLVVQHSFENLGSDYNYTQVEFNMMRYMKVFGGHYIEYALQAGYPLEVSNRPLTSFYYAGGYRVLRGYKFKEFRGDSILYGTMKYNIPLTNPKEEDYFKHISVSMFTWDVFMDAAKIGTKDIYTLPVEAKFAMGTGFGYKIVLFRLFPVKLELSAAKAMEDRPVYFYFTISTIYYTWRN